MPGTICTENAVSCIGIRGGGWERTAPVRLRDRQLRPLSRLSLKPGIGPTHVRELGVVSHASVTSFRMQVSRRRSTTCGAETSVNAV
eukprot:923157-Rhodomonas_salina.2